ncbi:Calpain-15 [Manis pentadactyla]|nr:Calpain-15 [Manis pentadactyla]
MTDVAADGGVSETLALRKKGFFLGLIYGGSNMVDQVFETLALRKELGPGSDLTGEQMVDQLYGEAWVNNDPETLALRELGPGSEGGESNMVDQLYGNVHSVPGLRGKGDIHDEGLEQGPWSAGVWVM